MCVCMLISILRHGKVHFSAVILRAAHCIYSLVYVWSKLQGEETANYLTDGAKDRKALTAPPLKNAPPFASSTRGQSVVCLL